MDLMPKMPFEEWASWLYRALCLAVFITVCYLCWHYGVLETKTADDAVMAAHIKADADALAKRNAQVIKDQQDAAVQYQHDAEANARESLRRAELQAAAERKKDEALATVTRRADALARELRSRPERPTGDAKAGAASAGAGTAAAGAACTGAQLYRSDAGFLVGEAARADRILIERDACFDKYEALSRPKASTKGDEARE